MKSDIDYDKMYMELGIDAGDMGCIMLDTEPIIINDIIDKQDYFYSDEHQYVSGNVSESVPHCTLLYGLMNSGPAMRKHVDTVLGVGAGYVPEWMSEPIRIKEVSFFYPFQQDAGDAYIAIIALLEVTDGLAYANGQLRRLPHIDTFQDYKPHVTLAYVKVSSDWQGYVQQLNEKYAGQVVRAVGINYGD